MANFEWPVNWHEVLELLQDEQKEDKPIVALVIRGDSFQVFEKDDLDFLIEAISAQDLPPVPPEQPLEEDFPEVMNDDDGGYDDGPQYA